MTTEKQLFDKFAALYREKAQIDADIAQLKADAIKDHAGELSKDDVADIQGGAALSVKDAAKKAKAEEKRIRREEIAERLAGGASAKTAARVADERRIAARQSVARSEATLDAMIYPGAYRAPHDADGVVVEREEWRPIASPEGHDPKDVRWAGGYPFTVAPIRRPDDADLDGVN